MIQNKPANTIKRVIAYFIDLLVCYFATILGMLIYISIFKRLSLFSLKVDEIAKYGSFVGQAMIIILPIYFIWFEYTKWQATLGKKLLNLKVEDLKHKKLSLYKVSLRVLLFRLLTTISFILIHFIYSKHTKHIIISGFMIPSLQHIKMLVVTVPEYVFLKLLFIIWFIPIIFSKNKMGIYELLSSTRVIHEYKK